MTIITKGMGVVKKILTKNRKDKLLDSIRTRRIEHSRARDTGFEGKGPEQRIDH